MSPLLSGILGIAFLLMLFAVGVPVAFAMALAGCVGYCLAMGLSAGLEFLAVEFFQNFASYSLTVVPMFVFMGCVAFEAGLTRRIFSNALTLFGQKKGGLAMASIAAAAGFAAICGSTNATTAAIGKIAIPEMKRYGYSESLATGSVAAAGTLGILIPPSALLIVYGILTQSSIGQLFVAGIIPGLLLASLFALTVHLWTKVVPTAGPAGPGSSTREKIAAALDVADVAMLFLFVIGGLYLGWFSPTQAGALGAAATIVVCRIRYNLNVRTFINAAKETIMITSMVMVVVAGAMMFGRFLAVTNLPFVLVEWVGNLHIPPWGVMVVIIVLHVIGGCLMDAFALIVLTVPIFFPLVLKLGFDPIWFGIVITLLVEMGGITPPVGINVFIVNGIAPEIPIYRVFKGAQAFLLPLSITIALLLLFPTLATFLPNMAAP